MGPAVGINRRAGASAGAVLISWTGRCTCGAGTTVSALYFPITDPKTLKSIAADVLDHHQVMCPVRVKVAVP